MKRKKLKQIIKTETKVETSLVMFILHFDVQCVVQTTFDYYFWGEKNFTLWSLGGYSKNKAKRSFLMLFNKHAMSGIQPGTLAYKACIPTL